MSQDNIKKTNKAGRCMRCGMEGDRLCPVTLPTTDIFLQPVRRDDAQRNQPEKLGEH